MAAMEMDTGMDMPILTTETMAADMEAIRPADTTTMATEATATDTTVTQILATDT